MSLSTRRNAISYSFINKVKQYLQSLQIRSQNKYSEMKPTTPTKSSSGQSSSSSSTSKHKSQNKVKKSNSSSKSKSKKSSSSSSSNQTTSNNTSGSTNASQPLTIQANLNHLHSSHEHSSPNSSSRDKNYQKTYVGISANSIRCIWEQYDSNETDINVDILPVLAEDASYRLWELGNNLKTFTKHSGGKLTTDIVNEVLKDCNVPPVIGARAGNSEWNRLDYDGTFYFHVDEIIDLRDEYLKDISSIQCGPLSLESNWVTNQRNGKDLTKLWKSIMLAIIMGDDVAFQYTIHTTLINPFVGHILPHLLQKSIEYLSFRCLDDTLDRLLRLLKAIVQNDHCRDVANNEEYFNLANIFVCLLLGSIDVKSKLEQIKAEQVALEAEEIEPKSNGDVSVKSDALTNGDNPITNGLKIDVNIKDELDGGSNDAYSKLVVNPMALGVGIKKEINHFNFEQGIKFEPNFYDMDFQEDALFECETSNVQVDVSNEKEPKFDVDAKTTISECFSSFDAAMCNDRYVNEVCDLVGLMGSKWGYFEHEMIYMLSKRLEIYFHENTTWTITEFQWLSRAIRVLCALGDVAFRELTIYFENIPCDEIPNWILPNLNFGAIFIRGKKDIYFYEYMQEACGDGLLPFMVFYSDYMKRLQAKTLAAQNSRKTPLKIATKTLLKTIPRPTPSKPKEAVTLEDMFPQKSARIRSVLPTTRKIGFKFAGCCPVPAKPRKNLSTVQQLQQSAESVAAFNSKFVIARRRQLKPIFINDRPRIQFFMDYRWLNL